LKKLFSDKNFAVWSNLCFLNSFLRSRVYEQVKLGDVNVKKTWEPLINELKKALEEEELKLFGYVEPVSSYMYDNRPDDPYETGDIDYGDFE